MATAAQVKNITHKTAMLKPTPIACDTTGNTAPNGGNLFLELNNSGASAYTVTVGFSNTVDGQAITPLTYTLAAGETRLVGGWPPSYYGSTLTFTANNVAVTYIAYTV